MEQILGLVEQLIEREHAYVVTAEEPEEQAQRMAAMGELVRLAHTDEGWVTLGYRTANNSVGQEWMLLEVGMTLMPGVQEQAVRRESITLTTPGGQMLALPSQDDFAKAIPLGVTKVNIDTDGRLVWTRVHRELFRDQPEVFDFRKPGKIFVESYANFIAHKNEKLRSAGQLPLVRKELGL